MSTIILNSNCAKPHVLCNACKQLWQSATSLGVRFEESHCSDVANARMPQHILHSLRRSEIQSAASAGCHFCSIIVSAVAGCSGDHSGRCFADDENGSIYISIGAANLGDVPGATTFGLRLFPCDESDILSHDQILNNYPLLLRPTRGIFPFSLHGSKLIIYPR